MKRAAGAAPRPVQSGGETPGHRPIYVITARCARALKQFEGDTLSWSRD